MPVKKTASKKSSSAAPKAAMKTTTASAPPAKKAKQEEKKPGAPTPSKEQKSKIPGKQATPSKPKKDEEEFTGEMLDSVFSDSEIDMEAWTDERNRKKEAREKGGIDYVADFWLKKKPPLNKGLISFLSDGFKIKTHSIAKKHNGEWIYPDVVCLGSNCPLCAAGVKVSKKVVYPIIDWNHTYTNKKKEEVVKPQFKRFLRGFNTAQLLNGKIERFGTLVGHTWEVTRRGDGVDTIYDFEREEEWAPDFEETMEVEGKDGFIDVPLIGMVKDWPAYTDTHNFYTKNKLRPKIEFDYSDPKHIEKFLQLHFLTEPISTYLDAAKSARKKAEEEEESGDVDPEDKLFEEY